MCYSSKALNMNRIKVLDKEFDIFIKQEDIENAIHVVAKRIDEDMKGRNPLFLVMLNGAFMFAAELFKSLEMDSDISFVKYSTYSGMSSTGRVNQLIGLSSKVEGRDIVIVEDIIDSGYTMKCLIEDLKNRNAGNIKIATMLFKPKAFKYDYNIDYVALEIGNEFILGYGLDYNEYGRSYKDIYIIVE